MEKKDIAGKMSFYRNIAILLYLFIAKLLEKIALLTRALLLSLFDV
jgi:hypothetical protein